MTAMSRDDGDFGDCFSPAAAAWAKQRAWPVTVSPVTPAALPEQGQPRVRAPKPAEQQVVNLPERWVPRSVLGPPVAWPAWKHTYLRDR
jgi:hypothetical protein